MSRELAEARRAHLAAEQQDRAAWLIGLCFGTQEDGDPDLYAITLQARNDGWPVSSGGQILLFTELELAPKVLAMDGDETVRSSVLPPLTLDDTYIYGVSEYVASVRWHDEDDSLVDFLNLLWDWTNSLRLDVPEMYRSPLWKLASHVTFQNDFGGFISDNNLSRSDLADGLFWCLGAIIANSRIVASRR